MTDLERWRAFADQAGVVYVEHAETWPGRGQYVDKVLVPFGPPAGTPVIDVRVDADGGPKNTGYGYFYTSLVFAADGALVEMGAWE